MDGFYFIYSMFLYLNQCSKLLINCLYTCGLKQNYIIYFLSFIETNQRLQMILRYLI